MFSKMASGVKASLQCWHRGQSWKWPTCPRHSEALGPLWEPNSATWIKKLPGRFFDSWMDPDQKKPWGCLMWFFYIFFSKHVSWQHRKLHIPRHLRRTPWLVVMGVPVLLTWGGHHLTWTFDWFCIIIGIVYPYLHPTFGQNSAECSFFSNEGVQIVSTHKSQLPIGRYPGWRNGLENCPPKSQWWSFVPLKFKHSSITWLNNVKHTISQETYSHYILYMCRVVEYLYII